MHKDNFAVEIAMSNAFSTTIILTNIKTKYKHIKRSHSYLSYNQIFVLKMYSQSDEMVIQTL